VKVVHLCNAPLAPDHPDYGRLRFHPGRWALNLARAQRDHCSIDAVLVVQLPGSARDYATQLDGVPVHYVAAPDKFRSFTLFMLDARRLANRVRDHRPDLVHAHGTEDAYGLAAQRSRLPYVITAQGLFFQINRAISPRLVSRERAVEFTEALCFRRARHVIAKSRYVRDALAARFPNLQLHEIPNTFDERLLTIQEVKRPRSLVYVGTISPHKGVHTLAEALRSVRREIPEVTLDIAGDWVERPFEYEIEQKRLLRQILGDKVIFHGQLGLLDLAHLVASSSALIAPSLEDMFGNQVIEALLLGTHAIVAEGTALAENVRRFGNGTVIPRENPEELARAISKVFVENRSPALVRQTRDHIKTAFGPAKVARLHEELYIQIRNEHPVTSNVKTS
jgi:glycosyltransferase involved in cell wall biosynthesis